jgi:hypothetical protein
MTGVPYHAVLFHVSIFLTDNNGQAMEMKCPLNENAVSCEVLMKWVFDRLVVVTRQQETTSQQLHEENW